MTHQKDFNGWNEKKKQVHHEGENKFYKPREVWWCAIGCNVGFEQDGGAKHERPVVVMRGFSKHVCLIIPLTTSTKENPYHVCAGEVDGRTSFAIISQMRLVDTKRFINKVGFLNKREFDEIRKSAKDLL